MKKYAFLFLITFLLNGLFSSQINAREQNIETISKAKGLSYQYYSSDGRLMEVKDGKVREVKNKRKSKSKQKKSDETMDLQKNNQ